MTVRDAAEARLGHILSVLKAPGGFSRLNPQQKKFLFGVVLATVVPSDHVVKDCETTLLMRQFGAYLGLTPEARAEAASLANMPAPDAATIDQLASALVELLGVHDRATLVRHLWELALADQELHSNEERLIYRIADVAGVPRKQVAEQLARVAAQS